MPDRDIAKGVPGSPEEWAAGFLWKPYMTEREIRRQVTELIGKAVAIREAEAAAEAEIGRLRAALDCVRAMVMDDDADTVGMVRIIDAALGE